MTNGLIHVFRQVGHVKVGVLRVTQGLQFGIVRLLLLMLVNAFELVSIMVGLNLL